MRVAHDPNSIIKIYYSKMKMYKQPEIEIFDLKGENLMQGVIVSPGTPTDPASPPGAGMPRRGTAIE